VPRSSAVTPDQFTAFGELLKFLRRRAGLSQRELSIAVGYSESQISRLELNQRPPDTASLRARFVPALGLEAEREWVARLVELAAAARVITEPAEPIPPAEAASRLPTGTVTFLFTDIEGSTQLWQQYRDAMTAALARHHAILKDAITAHGGQVFQIVGDAFCAAFATPAEGVGAALTAQRALRDEPWGETGPVRVRMALHCGSTPVQAGDTLSGQYHSGITLSRAARLLSAAHGGQMLLSQAAHELLRDQLPDGIGLRDLGEHQLKGLVRREHIYQVIAPDLAAAFPPLASLDAIPNNLPIQLTSFIGRERETLEVQQLLTPRRTAPAPLSQPEGSDRPEARLLTLTGAGGCGKTRLALQVAAVLAEQAQAYPDGVWLIELAPLVEPGLVPQVVASVLDVREQPGRQLTDTLSDALRSKRVLLVLDNCEHLIEACAALAQSLLRACSNLRILATSREALGVAGEFGWLVPSLSLPDHGRVASGGAEGVSAIRGAEAGRLFLERALAAQRSFTLTPRNALAVEQVCQRLDGIPLAIELAAARVRAMPVEQIAARLDDRFRLLTGGSRTALPHHQTLTALIDWSYDLLSEAERALLRRLSVFRGGWTLEAAEAVWAPSSPNPSPSNGSGNGQGRDLLDLLTHLVDKSLVGVEDQLGEARYALLETIRQYAGDKLTESGEAEPVREAHLAYFLQLAEAAEPKLHSVEQLLWLKRMEAEHDNFRAALRSSMEGQAVSADAGLLLASALEKFWMMHSHLGEGRSWLAGELGRARPVEPARQADWSRARAKALFCVGQLAFYQGDYAAARASARESLTLFREMGERAGQAAPLINLGLATLFQGDAAAARTALVESVSIYRDLQDEWGLGWSLAALGMAEYSRGDYTAAQASFDESRACLRETGDRWVLSLALTGLGRLALRQNDNAQARAQFERALVLRRELNDKFMIAHSLNYLGAVARREGNQLGAAAFFRESVSLFEETGSRHGLAVCLAGLGGVAADQGQPARAARILGGAAGALERLNATMVLGDPTGYVDDVAAARSALGEAAFAVAWAEGRALTLEQAIELALASR